MFMGKFAIKSSYIGLCKLFFVTIIILLIHFLIAKYLNYLLMIPFFFILGILYYHVIMIVHELVHFTFVPNVKLNKFLGNLISPLIGLNFQSYREIHFNHHKAKTIESDPDAYIYAPVLKEKKWYKRIAIFLVGSIFELFIKMKAKSLSNKGNFFNRYSVIIAQLALLLTFIVFSNPYNYFIFWLLPIITIGLFLNRLRVLIEHGYEFREKLNHNPQKTVNVKCNFLEKIIFAPHNFNYHKEHHDFPGIPYYQLPEVYKTRKKSVEEEHSYIAMLIKILFRELA